MSNPLFAAIPATNHHADPYVYSSDNDEKAELNQEDVKFFSDALAFIQVNYYEELDVKELFAAAVRGVVTATDKGKGLEESEILRRFEVRSSYDLIDAVTCLPLTMNGYISVFDRRIDRLVVYCHRDNAV